MEEWGSELWSDGVTDWWIDGLGVIAFQSIKFTPIQR
jgi:hypothetical protein